MQIRSGSQASHFPLVILASCIGFFTTACSPCDADEAEVVDSRALSGEELSRIYCVSCHHYTEPDLLPKKSWNFLLTYMGLRLGIDDTSYLESPTEVERSAIDARRMALALESLIPEAPAMSAGDWALLRQYYEDNSPIDPLPQENKPASEGELDLFKKANQGYQSKAAITSMIQIDEIHNQLLIGDSRNQQLTILDSSLNLVDHISSKGSYWVDATTSLKDIYLLSVGDIPGDRYGEKLGKLAFGGRIGEGYYPRGVLLKDLYRPSDFELVDIDQDGKDELLLCSFGDEGGDFSIYKREAIGVNFIPNPISTLYSGTGAIRCKVYDFNNDGLLDIVLMVSDFDEHLCAYLNRGDGSFEEKRIIETHPSFGFLNFQLVDFNKDGYIDILTSNGDNVDSDPYNTLKRFHGIRLYLNDGNLGFEQAYFYPMYGCFEAEAQDFDQDGDYDIAACAFYPNFAEKEPEHFVYLEQTEPLKFSPKHHSAAQEGRWMCMDTGDLDGDGDIDIALGASYVPLGMPVEHKARVLEQMEHAPAVLYLENQLLK